MITAALQDLNCGLLLAVPCMAVVTNVRIMILSQTDYVT
jgi:hypothetical protein